MTIHELIVTPFADYAFMRKALAACFALAIGGTPLGLFLTLRRMTLVGDAMQHAILPGVAIAFALSGLSLWAMTVGGILAGGFVSLMAAALAKHTPLKDDAAFTLMYLISLAVGVAIISLRGNAIDLLHVLFGNILAIDRPTLLLIAGVACGTLIIFSFIYRNLLVSCFDPDFAASNGRTTSVGIFYVLMVVNLVAAFQALGTLMALGLMILPALAAKFWVRTLDGILPLAMLLGAVFSPVGLLLSYHLNLPSGPAVVMTLGGVTLFSVLFGRRGGVLQKLLANQL